MRELLWIGNTVFTMVKHAFLRKNDNGEEYLIGIAHSVSVCKGSGGRPVYFVEQNLRAVWGLFRSQLSSFSV